MTSSSRRDTLSLWNSSSFLMPQNREKADSKVRGLLSKKKITFVLFVKHAQNAIVSPTDFADRGVMIHIPCDSIRFRLFQFDYVNVS